MAREDGDVVDRVRASDDGLETGDGQGLAVGVGDGGAVARETQGGASADAGEDALVEADRGEERVPTLLAGGEVAGVGVGDDVLGGGVEADVEENLLARVEPMQRRGVPARRRREDQQHGDDARGDERPTRGARNGDPAGEATGPRHARGATGGEHLLESVNCPARPRRHGTVPRATNSQRARSSRRPS